MKRNRAQQPPPSPYRALAHYNSPHDQLPDSVSLIRSFNVETNPTRPKRPSPLTASTIQDMPLDLVDRIRSFPLFVSAPDDFLAAIGKHLSPKSTRPTTTFSPKATTREPCIGWCAVQSPSPLGMVRRFTPS